MTLTVACSDFGNAISCKTKVGRKPYCLLPTR